ncbi:MAG: PilZ domain-containing protein [Candidatus Aminicenantes bacterium]|nr:MAG: PilZ domain-containing protein [Candidatus Aminicenantes bacterium]
MPKEKRKFLRFECLLPVELIKLEGKETLEAKATARDFSREGLKISVDFVDLKSGSSLDLKLYCPETKEFTALKGEVAWKKWAKDKLEVGLKIKEMDKVSRSEVLNWIFSKWLEKEREEKI